MLLAQAREVRARERRAERASAHLRLSRGFCAVLSAGKWRSQEGQTVRVGANRECVQSARIGPCNHDNGQYSLTRD